MHTLIVIGYGLGLLVLCLIVGRIVGSGSKRLGRAALIFLPLWFVAAGINMWIGVTHAGYSLAEEAPIFLIVFGMPAAIALLVWWKHSR